MYKTIILALLSIGSIVCDPVPNCPSGDIEPCRCYQKSSQIRCEPPFGEKALNSTRLKDIGNQINGSWKFLYIHDTQITTIETNTFQHAKFERIFIDNNNALTSIPTNAFGLSDVTQVIEIRNNAIVDAGPLFELAIIFEKSLRIFSLDGNKIKDIPKNKLVGDNNKFQKLQIVNLSGQTGTGDNALKKVPSGTVVNLKDLAQLSLDNNKIDGIENGAIVLIESQPTTKHISIFLNDNELDAAQLTKLKIVLPKVTNTETSIGLVLEHNKIITLPVVDDLISKIASKGNVYLEGNSIADCTCLKAKSLTDTMKLPGRKDSIQGISTISCGDKTFGTCDPPTLK